MAIKKPYALMHTPLCLGIGDPEPELVKRFSTVKEARKYCKENNISDTFHYIICTKIYSLK